MMMSDKRLAPRRIAAVLGDRTFDISGCLIPWKDGQPALFHMVGSASTYLACFTTPELLRACFASIGKTFDSIKQIDDGPEFLSSIPDSVVVVLDVRQVDGKTRFTQLRQPMAFRLSPEKEAEEVARIRDVLDWPCYPELHVKKIGTTGYDVFGTVRCEGERVIPIVHIKRMTAPVQPKQTEERFESVEAMVAAGWIGD